MNFTTLRLRLARIVHAVLSYFDSGLDGAIAAFTRADRKLDAFKARLEARINSEFDLQTASYDREAAVRNAESAARAASYERVDSLLSQRTRAAAIQSRINELLK
jgi:hypothetical protein